MSETELTELIERIKNRRLALELSYQDLSDATGISKSTLQRYETGFIKKVPINQMEVLAKALHVTPAYLMGWEESSPTPLPLTQQEETHIKKYRQLDADGRERVDYVLDMEYKLANERAEKEEQRLG